MADKLDRLRELKTGWDGYAGPPISEKALRTAASIQYTPMSSGGLMIELHGFGPMVEIEVEPDGAIGNVSVTPTGR